MADRAGEQLGNYRLLKLIGRGGFADVYLGEHVRLGNQAAIKILQTRLETEDIESFQREARTIGRLSHPNIVRVFDFAVQDGVAYLAMDYAPNGTLRQRYAKGVQVPLETILLYVRQVADALQYAHEQRVVHRDIKPENMLIGRLDDILLSDFGIAVVSQSSRYQTSNEMVGTVGYMSPEQIQGHPRPASDQYSLGIVVYEWLSGARPFSGSVTEVATKHLVVPPPSLRVKIPSLAPAVEDVVMTALAKDPDQRFGSVRAFAAALENAAHAEPSFYALSTQLDAPAFPPPPGVGTPANLQTPSQPSGPSGRAAMGAPGYFPAASQESAVSPYAPTVGESMPGFGQVWSNAETIRGSQPVGSQPPGAEQIYGGSQPYGSPPAALVGVYGSAPSQPWSYGASDAAQVVPPPPPPPLGPPSGVYQPPLAPAGGAPPKARRGLVLWSVIVVLVLLLGGGGVAAFILLTPLHPVIQVASSYPGTTLGGPPDTVLHISGQHFASNSTITFLLDNSPAPGAQLAQSDGTGAFTVSLTITDDWTFAAHVLTARDASGNVTQSGTSITVIPQPVLNVTSDYNDGSVPVGSLSTSFTIAGKRFAPNAQVTFLLDGKPISGVQPLAADAKGRVQTTLTVGSSWSVGNHTLTAQDNQGNSTKSGISLEVVHQGAGGTPGPHGAPTDSATFSISITVKISGGDTFTMTLNVSNGKVCDNGSDTGQPQNYSHTFSDGTSYNETYVWTCSGTYKAGHLTYTETDTSDTFTLSDGGYCVASTPRVEKFLDGTFSSASAISGTFRDDALNINCPTVNTFYLTSSGAESGSWSGNA
ncbi:MAG TPA: protein kinase [Ktedonobacterales bacterium]|nr:protein kinase [Ktedonobacterales bacterium]